VLPAIGMRDVAEIKPADILATVRSVESRGALDVAKRIRQTISSIFRYAVASSLATTDPAAPLVDAMLPRPRVKRTRATGVAETVAGFTVSRERWLMAMSSTLARRACGSTLDGRGRRIAGLNRLPKRDLVLQKAGDLVSERVFDTDIEMALGR